MPRERLKVENLEDITVVRFLDRKILDEQNIQTIRQELFNLVDKLGRIKILLDFGNLEYLSAIAFGTLITLHKKVSALGGKLVLCRIDPLIYEVFEITRLDKFFKIAEDEQEGLLALEN